MSMITKHQRSRGLTKVRSVVIGGMLLYLVAAGAAFACIAVPTWKAQPSAETIENSPDIYLARLARIDSVDDSQTRLSLTVVEQIRGTEVDELTIFLPFRAFRLGGDKVFERWHDDAAFWLGERNNTFLMPDCSIAPHKAHVGRAYLLLLQGSSLTSLLSFEPIDSLANDRWLRFVRKYAEILESISPSDADCCRHELN